MRDLMVMRRVYIRLVGLKPSPRDGHPEANQVYAPSFHIHEEVVSYHVSCLLNFGLRRVALIGSHVALSSR